MRRLLTIALMMAASLPSFAQLSPAQREADFIQLASLFWKQYGPYEWKRELFSHDMRDLRPWLQQVRAVANDVEYLEICSRYTAALRDSHVFFNIPSSYQAAIDIGTDIYDGRVLVEGINRQTLPMARFPINVGDEVISIDGKPVMRIIDEDLRPYMGYPAFERASRRYSADFLFFRTQVRVPRAPEQTSGENAMVVTRNAAGEEMTHSIPWRKRGTPVTSLGTLPGLITASSMVSGSFDNGDGNGEQIALPPDTPEYMKGLLRLGHASAPLPLRDDEASADSEFERGLLGFGSSAPYYALPAGFEARQTSNFLVGRFTANGRRIGLMRIGTMSPPQGLAAAYAELDREARWLQDNTDALIIDVSRNTGGFIIYGHEIARRLTRQPFEAVGFELRATAARVQGVSNELESARLTNAPSWVIGLWEKILSEITTAYSEPRGRTGALPLNMPTLTVQPVEDAQGNRFGYSKPIIVAIDEFSVSTGDLFPAVMQDMGRAKLVGFRTGGLGATNGSFAAQALSETTAGVSFGLMVRPKTISVEGYPATNYIENVGVHPDIMLDYMTRENLVGQGRPWFARLTELILAELN
jgi:hypothetical protein